MIRSGLLCILASLLPFTIARAQIVIETPFFEGGSGKDFYLLAAREYEKVRPGVRVDMYLDPRIAEKVQVRLLEGDFPEITNPGTINYWPLIDNGDVLQVDEFLDGPSWDTFDANGKPVKWRDTFLPGSLETYARDGKHYGIPLGYYAYVFWYNKKMFRDNGWPKPKTWDELFEEH